MAELPSVLMIGESPTLLHLAFALTTVNWRVTLLPYTERNYSRGNKTRKLYTMADLNHVEFTPFITISNLVELATLVAATAKLGQVYDYIFLNSKIVEFLELSPDFFNKVLGAETLIIYDCTGYFLDDSKLQSLFPDNCILSIFSDIDCRLIDAKSNSYQLVSDNFKVIIGNTIRQLPMETIQCLNLKGRLGEALIVLSDTVCAAMGTNSVEVLRANLHKKLTTAVWNNITSKVCIEALTIVFEEPDLEKMANDQSVTPVLKGVFREIWTISKKYGIKDFGGETLEDAKIYLNRLLKKEIARTTFRKQITKVKPYLPMYIDSNKEFFDFSQGNEMTLINLFFNLLRLADTLNVNAPFMESMFSFLSKLTAARDGIDIDGKSKPSVLFQVKNNRNKFIMLDTTKNGVSPEMNMMNFPPFYPCPKPTLPGQNPVIMMSVIHSEIVKEEEDTEIDLDLSLQQLLVGAEEMTYGEDVFFDSAEDPEASLGGAIQAQQDPSHMQIQTPTSGSVQDQLQTMSSAQLEQLQLQLSQQQQILSEQNQQNPPRNHQNAVYFAPISNYSAEQISKMSPQEFRQYQFQMQISAQVSAQSLQLQEQSLELQQLKNSRRGQDHAPASSGSSNDSARKKNFHYPTQINRNTTKAKLKESHIGVLQMVNFNGLVNLGTSNRYGAVDTSTAYLNNSSKNSSRSSVSKTSSQTNGFKSE